MTSPPSRANGAVLLLGVGIGCFAAGLLTGVFAARLAATNSAAPESAPATTARATADAGSVPDRPEPAPPAKSQASPSSGGYGRKAPPPPPALESTTPVTVPADPPKPPAPSDRDGDGTPDDKDGCPDNKSLQAPRDYYGDSDGDGAGDPAKKQSSCESTPPTGFVDNANDKCPSNKSLQAPRDYYDDSDGDGAGDPKVKQSSCESTPPRGYVDNANDECPKRKDKQKQEQCGCDWPYPDSQDRDGNGINDCIEDDDHDGVPNRDDRDYVPTSAAVQELARIYEVVRQIQARIAELDPEVTDYRAYTARVEVEMRQLKRSEDEVLRLLKQLHAAAKSKPGPHGFDRTVFPAGCGCSAERDPQLVPYWIAILKGLDGIAKLTQVAYAPLLERAQREAILGGKIEDDRDLSRVQHDLDAAFDRARRAGPAKLFDKGVIERELLSLNALQPERSP